MTVAMRLLAFAAALAVFDRAAKSDPAPALSEKGALLSHLGRLTEACSAFDEALTLEPTWVDAWYNKSSAKTFVNQDPDIDSMERLLGRCPYRDRLLLHFALGKAHMDTGDADRAFAHWHEGNRLKRAATDYDAGAPARQMATSAERPPHADLRQRTTPASFSEVPVFVVGMPRCGSSLIEQILASHPAVHGAGELMRLRTFFETSEPRDRPIADMAIERMRRFSPRGA